MDGGWRIFRQCIATFTPPKTNMEPENDGFFIEISSSRASFSGSMLVPVGKSPQKGVVNNSKGICRPKMAGFHSGFLDFFS